MQLVDSHCHLNYPEFTNIAAILESAKEQGVTLCQTISTKRSDFEAIFALIDAYEAIVGSVGIHPHEAEHHQDFTVAECVELTNHPKIVGIGETGLDYYYEHSPKKEQQTLFRRHIEAAQQAGLPLIVHTRDAEEDTIAILREMREQGEFSGLIHCFSGTQWLADKALELGLYISISGIITFKKADALRDVVQTVPLDRLLVETDAPYLAPVPYRGKPNQPAYTRYTAEKLAEIKGVSVSEIALKTTNNFMILFNKANVE